MTTKIARLEEHDTMIRDFTEYGIGVRVIAHNLNTIGWDGSYGVVQSYRKNEAIEVIRDFDMKYEANRKIYGADIPTDMVTHAMDGYGLNTGSFQTQHHHRYYVWWINPHDPTDKRMIKVIMIVNIRTNKRYWIMMDNPSETPILMVQCINKAIEGGEDIKVLRLDQKFNDVIDSCESMGIKPIIYGKTYKELRDGVLTAIPYNTPAEMQFGNPSKCFYSIMDRFNQLPYEMAKQLFSAILSVYWDYNPRPLQTAIDQIRLGQYNTTDTHYTAKEIKKQITERQQKYGKEGSA